jgi:hypothetical protein
VGDLSVPAPSEPTQNPVGRAVVDWVTGSSAQGKDCLVLNFGHRRYMTVPVAACWFGCTMACRFSVLNPLRRRRPARAGDAGVSINLRLRVLGFLHLAEMFDERFADSGNVRFSISRRRCPGSVRTSKALGAT